MRKNILKKVATLGLVSIMALSQATAIFAATDSVVIKPDIATVRSNTSYTYYVRSGMTSSGKESYKLETYHTYSVRGSSRMTSVSRTYYGNTAYKPVQTIIGGNVGDHVYYERAFSKGYYYTGSTYKHFSTRSTEFNR